MTGTVMALVLAAAAPAAVQAQDGALRSIDETRQVDRDVDVEVEALVRTVRVTGWDRAEVRVRGKVHREKEEFVFEGDRSSVQIGVEKADGWRGFHGDDGPDPGPLAVSVPRGASVRIDVVNGAVSVENVDGAVSLESVNGAVRYTGNAEHVEAETVNGEVEVQAPRARRTRASSVNGGVALRVAGGYVDAETVSGDVEVLAGRDVERVHAEAVSGDLSLRGELTSGASLRFETHSGDVVLHLPPDLQGRLEAATFSGDIESAFGGQVEKASRWTSEKRYRHAVGSGEVRVSAESFSGDVRFLKEGG